MKMANLFGAVAAVPSGIYSLIVFLMMKGVVTFNASIVIVPLSGSVVVFIIAGIIWLATRDA